MEQLNHTVQLLALTMGTAWASGINLYAAILVLGLMGFSGDIILPRDLQILANPYVIGAAGFMYLVEFVADKIPGVDSAWDALHTFIRIPAGALLAAGAVGQLDPALSLAAAIIGGGLTAATHVTKAGSRAVINTSPEPVTNWTASITEDLAVVAGLWAAFNHPWIFLVLLMAFIILMIWLLPKVWRRSKRAWRYLRSMFRKNEANEPPALLDQDTPGDR
jgi:Domain of unknown function (DUF4126)